jgi:hypothetical protein
MEYNIVEQGSKFVVANNAGQHFGEYENPSKAKRRIRDLKAHDAAAFKQQPIDAAVAFTPEPTGNQILAAQIDRDEDAFQREMGAVINSEAVNDRQVGVYPARPKKSYLR